MCRFELDPAIAKKRKELAGDAGGDRQEGRRAQLRGSVRPRTRKPRSPHGSRSHAGAAVAWEVPEFTRTRSDEGGQAQSAARWLDPFGRPAAGEGPPTRSWLDVKSRPITAVRLEVLTDDSLPHKGPGRQDNGNLHLSEFSVCVPPPASAPKPKPVAIRHATCRLRPGRLDDRPRHRRQPDDRLGHLSAGRQAA